MGLDFLWLAAPLWKLKLLVMIILAQMALTIWLYLQLSKARVSAKKAGIIKPEDYAVVSNEPQELAVYTRALANQFELPVLFYGVIITGIAMGVSSLITVFLGALFVVTRIIHAHEMIGENRVLLRRKYFINSVRVFILLMVELLFSTLFFF